MPYPSQHLAPTAAPHPDDDKWQTWSHAWTKALPRLTGRHDLSVLVAPGAGGGAPACFYPEQRRIEIDAVHIGTPDITDPRRARHKQDVPVAYGLLIHEAGHATHSRWRPPPHTPAVVAVIADLLEESRAEARHRTRRRGDRRWLRTAVTALINPDDTPIDDTWHAAYLAGLLLARVDARILTHKDTRDIRTAVTTVLGRRLLRQLRDIWRHAHTVDDTDTHTMIELARRWCHLLGIDPDQRPYPPLADPAAFPGRLAAALTGYLAAAAGQTPGDYTTANITTGHRPPADWTHRRPTDDERRAARQLATRLQQARTTVRETTTTAAALPPGRLRTRHAITAQAQKASGNLPTAAPWQKRADLPPPKPTLHLAVLVDTSGSMRDYATIAFSDTVTLLTPPRHRPSHILDIHPRGGTHTFTRAVKLADQLLNLRQPRRLRMLAVVSDGHLADTHTAQKLITTLHHTGCPVLWLHPTGMNSHTYTHTTAITIENPIDAVRHIADAAVTALQHA